MFSCANCLTDYIHVMGANTVPHHTHSIYIHSEEYIHGPCGADFLMNLTTHEIIYKFIRKPGVQEGVMDGLFVWGW